MDICYCIINLFGNQFVLKLSVKFARLKPKEYEYSIKNLSIVDFNGSDRAVESINHCSIGNF